ncbi:MAG: cyclodeaminase/cyclohydrolase family protein [Phycisphaeraceae bacterium]|nr:cyclodeaminase/cyclohydrolase family protein [Phycisphaeraceae bacterium]
MPAQADTPASFADMRFADFLAAVAAKSPAPGGGAVASASGALAAALAQMVVNYSIGKRDLAEQQEELRLAAGKLERARALFLQLADEDAAAYSQLNALQKLPPGDARRAAELPEAERLAVQVPQSVAATAIDLLRHFEQLALITNRHLRTDLGIAADLAEATVRAALWNVRINAQGLEAGSKSEVEGGCARSEAEASERRERVRRACAV